MKYKLMSNIYELKLKKGDIFEFNKEGYVHKYQDLDWYRSNDPSWIGLPKEIVENSRFFEEIPEEEDVDNFAIELLDAVDEFKNVLDKIFRKHL